MATSTTNQIADYSKYANLQMAAEALYQFKATGSIPPVPGSPTDPATRYQGLINPVVLTDGNLHSSKFVQSEAEKLSADWTVVDHIPDTKTGFSGTLFKNRFTDELVLSFRSTEFIDDAARDNTATNNLEIRKTGFAMGQIDDMEQWFKNLKDSGKITGPLTVTGYSLGGHLATAFNLLHQGETAPNTTTALVQQVYTFNGAGIGLIDGAQATTIGLGEVMQAFREVRNQADFSLFLQSDQGRTVYGNLQAQLLANAGIPTRALANSIEGLFQPVGDGLTSAEVEDKNLLTDAFLRILEVSNTVDYMTTLHAGNPDSSASANPARVPASSIEAFSLDYQLAVLIVDSSLRPASNHPIWETRSCA